MLNEIQILELWAIFFLKIASKLIEAQKTQNHDHINQRYKKL